MDTNFKHCFAADGSNVEGAIAEAIKIARIRIYDNGSKTLDHYTCVFMDRPFDDLFEALGFNAAPFHPQGIGQHTSAMPGRHLGRRIKFEALNADCQQFIRQNL